MKKLNRILIPTDFSEESAKACLYAESLLKVFGGKVDMIHIVPTIKYLHESLKKTGYPFSLDRDIYPHIVEDTGKMVEEEMHSRISKKYRGEVIVKIGRKAYEIILEHAHKEKYDLIVMGSQGADAGHIIRGHVTEKVIRYSKVPVLSVSGTLLPESTNKILVPTDFSEISMKAILPAAIIAGRLKSDLVLFYVEELHGSEPDEREDVDEEAVRKFRKKGYREVKSFFESHPKANITVKCEEDEKIFLHLEREQEKYKILLDVERVRGVSAHYEIVDYGEQYADMIVIATHGRSGFSHILMGSTAEKVVQRAKIPVMTTRPKEMISPK